jgi:SPP1 gp7 family putative phage head morphogenesis protein
MNVLRAIVDFFDAPTAASFDLPPAQAIAFFKAKGLKTTFDWRDMLGAEHANAFTIAKMADLDMLADMQASLDDALAQGLSYQSWADSITPMLQKKGWWGKQSVTDPLTGETITAQLGSPARLKTIFRTNAQSAYAAGQWEQIQEQKLEAPYLMYDAVDDGRTRPEHAAWDGTVLPVEHDFWRTHYPPNGWNCRCGVIQLSDDDLEDLGLGQTKAPPTDTYNWTNPRTGKAMKIPKGLDPGWDANPGATRLQQLQKLAAEKLKTMTPKAATAGAKGLKAAGLQAAQLADAAGITVAPAIEAPVAALAKGAGKAQLRKAEAAIADALKANTPYLAKAIQKIQAAKATKDLGPIEQLAAAQAEAGKVKDAAALANCRKGRVRFAARAGAGVHPRRDRREDGRCGGAGSHQGRARRHRRRHARPGLEDGARQGRRGRPGPDARAAAGEGEGGAAEADRRAAGGRPRRLDKERDRRQAPDGQATARLRQPHGQAKGLPARAG